MGGFAFFGNQEFLPLGLTEATPLWHTVSCAYFLSFSCIMHSWNVDFKTQCRMFDPQALPQDLLSTHHLTMFRLTPGHLQVTSVLQPSQPQGLEGSIPLPHSPFTLSTCSSWSCPELMPERKGSQLSVWKWPKHPWQSKGCGLAQHHNSSPVCDQPTIVPSFALRSRLWWGWSSKLKAGRTMALPNMSLS